MKHTNNTHSASNGVIVAPVNWYHVRAKLRWILALSIAFWIGLMCYETTRLAVLEGSIATVTSFVRMYPGVILNVLATVAVTVAVAEWMRSSRRGRAARLRIARHLRISQRLHADLA